MVESHDDILLSLRDPHTGKERLRKISIFGGLSDEELIALNKQGEIRVINPKSNAVIEGESSRGLYIILTGTVSVYKHNPSNDSLIRLAFLEAGAFFGELSLFDAAPRSATVTAESLCHMFYLDIEVFQKFLEERGDNIKFRFYQKCAEDMVERFRRQNSDYVTAQQLLWQYALRK